jgi:hypothetical protein
MTRYLVAGYVLVAFNAVWLWTRARPDAVPPAALLADAPAPAARATLAVYFTPRDCPALIESLEKLNGAGTVRIVGVVGLSDGDGKDEMERVRAGAGLTFPLLERSADEVRSSLRGLGHGAAPVAIVFDAEMGVRSVVPLADEAGRRTLVQMAARLDSLPPAGPT